MQQLFAVLVPGIVLQLQVSHSTDHDLVAFQVHPADPYLWASISCLSVHCMAAITPFSVPQSVRSLMEHPTTFETASR